LEWAVVADHQAPPRIVKITRNVAPKHTPGAEEPVSVRQRAFHLIENDTLQDKRRILVLRVLVL
jgi:hypothetical protein